MSKSVLDILCSVKKYHMDSLSVLFEVQQSAGSAAIDGAFLDAVAGSAPPPAVVYLQGHGERSRSQLLLKLAGAENVLILAVNVLAVNGALHALYSVKKCLIQSIVSKSVVYTLYSVNKTRFDHI